MGAQHVVEKIKGPSLKEAFGMAQDQAAWESGSSYSGTISQATGCELHTTIPLLEWDAFQLAGTFDAEGWIEKWGPARAVPIGVAKAGSERTVEIVLNHLGRNDHAARREALAAAIDIHRRAGEGIVSVRLDKPVERYLTFVDVPKEATKRRFAVYGIGNKPVYFDSQAEARAHAKMLVDDIASGTFARREQLRLPLTIIGETVRESGAPLVTVGVDKIKSMQTAWVTFAKVDEKAPVTEWVVAGVYSS